MLLLKKVGISDILRTSFHRIKRVVCLAAIKILSAYRVKVPYFLRFVRVH